MTGSEFFPGGAGGYTAKAGSLKFENGPTTDVPLQWATYFDAADQAGRSRLWGGIHLAADDLTGREVGIRGRDRGLERRAALLRRDGRVVTHRGRRVGGRRRGSWACWRSSLSRGVLVLGRVPTPRRRAPWALRGSWRRRRPLASPTRTTAVRRSRPVAAWPSWTATRTAARTCTSRAAPTRRSCSATAATSGARLAFTPVGDAVTDVTGVTGAYPLDVDGDGHTDLAVLRVGETLMLRGLGGCRFERADETWGLRLPSLRVDDRILGDLGGGPGPADARRRQLPRARSVGRADQQLRHQRAVPPGCGRGRVRATDHARARVLHAVDAVQRLGRLGPA